MGRQGAALIISLFVLLVITGMGLLAVVTATEEIQSAGNYRLERQAEQVSYSALAIAMGEVGENGDAYWTVIKQQMYAAMEANATDAEVDATKSFTFVTADFTGKMLDNPTGDFAQHYKTDTPSMQVVMKDPLDGFNAPGYSGKFCFKRFRFDSFGGIGTEPTVDDLQDPHFKFSLYNHRAFGILGPMQCEGN